MKPKASTKTRDKYIRNPDAKYIRNPNAKGTRLHVGTETVREAQCPRPEHRNKTSSSFEGVNDAGWLFCCSGLTGEGWHHFVAEPAE